MRINAWHISSFLISIIVVIPLITVFTSFFDNTSNYYEILKNTFLLEYISNSIILLFSVLIITFILGTGSAYLVSFHKFPLSNFFKWALILSFAVPPYIYAYSLFAFFENYGTAFTILKFLFGDANYNRHIPKFDGMFGLILSISFSWVSSHKLFLKSQLHPPIPSLYISGHKSNPISSSSVRLLSPQPLP